MRVGVEDARDLTLDEVPLARLHRIFAQDYAQLGYGLDGQIARNVVLDSPPLSGVWPLWPAFFSDQDIRTENASDALPADDVNLRPFVDDVIAGVPKSTWPARSDNLIEHFHKILPEYVGKPVSRIWRRVALWLFVEPRGGEGLALFHRILS